ncbi:membrane protein [Bordetella ansorpii]|uniref:diguanylate cyclase n=1 Tax=Bordetella ansorpii TaxID=288768 RepID=A0A157S797_9BORD|nr:GGDEF domain-containing protein [Bordetella ansorpii]SAI65776.1 membrane protein [Bordetella ansorpii]
MHVDLLTLYLLATGTLAVSAGLLFWEQRANPKRATTLKRLALGFGILAVGCVAALYRGSLPSPLGSALGNLIILSGYLLVLAGVGSFSGRRYRAFSGIVLIGTAAMWALVGAAGEAAGWSYYSSVPIALISGMTAWAMWRCQAMKAFPARHIVVAVAAIHTLLYAGRATILPWFVAHGGLAIQAIASKITIYEGVLYSVALPMALLKVIRDETHGQLLRESLTDYLTRLGNRRWFFEEGPRRLHACAGRGPAALLAFDLDQFKAINDAHGHSTGDRVLKTFAEVARDVLGPQAVLARIGGEEFAALLVGDDARRARQLGEKIARCLPETIAQRIEGLAIATTVSIGMSVYQENLPTLPEGLSAADQALYRAKSLGGNRLEEAV